MKRAGVNTKVFTAHSPRYSTSSVSIMKGISIEDIVKKWVWKSSSSFKWFHKLRVANIHTCVIWYLWEDIFKVTLLTEYVNMVSNLICYTWVIYGLESGNNFTVKLTMVNVDWDFIQVLGSKLIRCNKYPLIYYSPTETTRLNFK